MKRPANKTWWWLGVSVLTLGLLCYGCWRLGRATAYVSVDIFPDEVTSARLVEREGGAVGYEVRRRDGTWGQMTPRAFAEGVWRAHESRSPAQRLMLRSLNISSTATAGWVLVGLLGQVLFAGRMVVQWLASEKQRRSVIPTSFWWMALGGASLLAVYFVWRKDVVGILGQGTGWLIYSRNLYFIYLRGNKADPDAGGTQPANHPAA